ncbi:bifunctional DNA-formamidopyrimidine glycosylase/DNA-(apurinic or apyrimidinic site) lyase [Roseibium sediminis]|uniref:bifunctional DNA-formamidopyrimidine glycosylase/DNA-(apurinic or apyrimidinic site) lyase n=1 Tax=Roseibium sediminis TaxID=1775174 RepID=UPI00123D4D94|nr:bifunctional DNA-formamidopyrimidine glycosylase/DNA-(apurinic or apyrimidinic site) lyase [Roseibium sediminis]
MPELPEVETVRRGLAPSMEGARIVKVDKNRPDLRFPFPLDFVKRLEGSTLAALSRRSKYLLADTDHGDVLVMHLGMSGSFRVEGDLPSHTPGDFAHERSKDPKHDHVIFHLTTATGASERVIYNDPRRFGFMTLIPRPELAGHALFAKMGMEPLGNDLDGQRIADLFAGKKTPLKAALLDQRLIAGLGNIYVCEALWRTGLDPKRAAGTLATKTGKPTEKAILLSEMIRQILLDAIQAGGSTLRDHTRADGSLGYFQHSFDVYGREGEKCRGEGCTSTIERIVQSGRSTFFCPKCQR